MRRDRDRKWKRAARETEKAGWMFLLLLVVLLVFGSWLILDNISDVPGAMDAMNETGDNAAGILGHQTGNSR